MHSFIVILLKKFQLKSLFLIIDCLNNMVNYHFYSKKKIYLKISIINVKKIVLHNY